MYFDSRICTFSTFGKASVKINTQQPTLKKCIPLMKPLHCFCLSNLFFWWNTIYRSVMQYLLLCLISKARRTSRNLEEIIASTNKFVVPGTNINAYSVHNAAGFWYNVCKDLQVPNTLANRKKKSSGIPTFEGNLLLGWLERLNNALY